MVHRARWAIPFLMFRWQPRSWAVSALVVILLSWHAFSASAASALVPDPRKDGWESEGLTDDAGKRLKLLGKMFEHPETADQDHLKAVFVSGFQAVLQEEAAADQTYQDGVFGVTRTSRATREFKGEDAPARFVRALAEPFAAAKLGTVRSKFKVFQISLGATNHFETLQYVALIGELANGMLEQNSTWLIRWRLDPTEGSPRIVSVQLQDFEQVRKQGLAGPLLSDCTEAVFAQVPSYRDQLCYSVPHWRHRIEDYFRIYQFGHNGLALGDVNGDGLDDLYVCQNGGLPNRLYVQQKDGTLADVSAASGADFLDQTQSALLVDLDNDGDQDLLVGVTSGLLVMSNDGSGRFTKRRFLTGLLDVYSLAVADYDADGRLDIYACVYFGAGGVASELAIPVPYFDANNGGQNHLYRNEGDWNFTDVTGQVGLNENNHRFSFAAAWDDYDNDGDLDLYVANDFGKNNLYRNEGGRFRDVASEAGLDQGAFGMSASFGDINRDGLMDIHMGAMFSGAGSRVTRQPTFKPGASEEVKGRFQLMARGNVLFENLGKAGFRDVSVDAGITMGRWAWASVFADLNNDGWEDLLVANGFVTGPDLDDL